MALGRSGHTRSPEAANRLLDMGVDGLITNNTPLIWKTLALRWAKVS